MWKKWLGKKKNTIENDQLLDKDKMPKHIAIIMDGNGRF